MQTESELVKMCGVCDSIYRKYTDEWVKIDKALYHTILANYEITHTYCSAKCISDSCGISYERAEKIMNKNKE